jgi:hypothetical protein
VRREELAFEKGEPPNVLVPVDETQGAWGKLTSSRTNRRICLRTVLLMHSN